jgi:hypothetical protein
MLHDEKVLFGAVSGGAAVSYSSGYSLLLRHKSNTQGFSVVFASIRQRLRFYILFNKE